MNDGINRKNEIPGGSEADSPAGWQKYHQALRQQPEVKLPVGATMRVSVAVEQGIATAPRRRTIRWISAGALSLVASAMVFLIVSMQNDNVLRDSSTAMQAPAKAQKHTGHSRAASPELPAPIAPDEVALDTVMPSDPAGSPHDAFAAAPLRDSAAVAQANSQMAVTGLAPSVNSRYLPAATQ